MKRVIVEQKNAIRCCDIFENYNERSRRNAAPGVFGRLLKVICAKNTFLSILPVDTLIFPLGGVGVERREV